MRRPFAVTALALLVCIAFGSSILAETILLPRPVPSFNQNYTDGPGAWGDCPLGTAGCPDQICTTGCLVTAFASVLGYYDVELSVSAGFSCTGRARSGMDPGILNDWLRENGGFGRCAQDPVGSCCLFWSQVPGEIELTTYTNRSDDGLNPVSAVVIDHALREGRPVIAGVHWDAFCRSGSDQTEDCHWIVLTGKVGETYTILDTINLDTADSQGVRTTLDAGTRGSYVIDRFVVVSLSDPAAVVPDPISDVTGTPSTEADPPLPGASVAVVLLGLVAAVAAIIVLATAR